MPSLIPYAPKQITHVQTIISECERNGAKWEVGHIAIYLTKRGWGVGNWDRVYAEAEAAAAEGFRDQRSDFNGESDRSWKKSCKH